MCNDKKEIRSFISRKKKMYPRDTALSLSRMLFERLENSEKFIQAENILMYYSLPDEVDTHEFIEKWYNKKRIMLPVVVGDDLEIREYSGKSCLDKGKFNIEEPQGKALENTGIIDLAIIPGVSFDNKGNRIGRGKGYYDRLLSKLSVYKIGVCFSFQIWEKEIPADSFDITMDEVWTENGKIK